jgi:Lrp/AsnC family transcriptional regulator, leucine-responsive regulatory protein
MQLAKKNRLILKALQQDARQSLAALGRRIGLSQPAISERVRKLEEGGVIAGYGARINLNAVGLKLQAVVRIRTTHEHIQRYVTLFKSMPEVLDAVRVTDEDCFVVRCAFEEPKAWSVSSTHWRDTAALARRWFCRTGSPTRCGCPPATRRRFAARPTAHETEPLCLLVAETDRPSRDHKANIRRRSVSAPHSMH